MGTDNLFHKRKAKTKKDLQRESSFRKEYDKVLIVCEGEKTEPHYFKELIKFHQISSANVKVDGNCGSSPQSILRYAEQLWKNDRTFDRVYCVFDKDSHHSYVQTVKEIQNIDHFYAITSVPCFEYWILLHFIFTTKPFNKKGSSSVANETLKELWKYMPHYNKGNSETFIELLPQLEFAIDNAKRSNDYCKKNHTDMPSTKIHELVIYLREIKKSNHEENN